MFDLTKQVDHIPKWDHLFIKGAIIKSYDENLDLIHVTYSSGVPLVSNRDFVYIEARTKREDGVFALAATSVLYPREKTRSILFS